MKTCFFQNLALLLGGLVLGILTFILLFTGILTLIPATPLGIVFFALVILLAGGGLVALSAAALHTERTRGAAEAWLCCGDLTTIGAIGTVLTGLLTLLTTSLEVGLYIGVALLFFFLFLFLGGLVCLLRRCFLINRCC